MMEDEAEYEWVADAGANLDGVIPPGVEDALLKLRRDFRQTAATLTAFEARFLVDAYYQMQGQRIRVSNRIAASDKLGKPHDALTFFLAQSKIIETQVARMLDYWTRDHPCSQWARGVCGIGPVISAGLRAHVDIATSSSVSKLWSFAGLNPTVTWDKGVKRPWNGRLKRLCWIIGESFVKVKGNTSDVYGKLYDQRRAYEDTRNAAGAYAELATEMLCRKRFGDNQTRKAYEEGKLPKGHLHARAKRYATKLFLSHYWAVAYGYVHQASPPRPWIVTERGGHAQVIAVPNWPHPFPQYV